MATVAALAVAAGGQIFSGMSAQAEGESAQNVAKYNAQLAEREAQAIEQKSAFEQQRQAEAGERQRSTMIAGMGASGVLPGEGTALNVLGEQAYESSLENRIIGQNYGLEAARMRSQGQAELMQGKIAKQRAGNQALSSFMGAGTTLLTGFKANKQRTGSYFANWK
jgi:hypothetical protein